VQLIPGQFVKPFVKTNKNDFNDVEAIAEAVTRQNMHFEPRTRGRVAQPDDGVTPPSGCARWQIWR